MCEMMSNSVPFNELHPLTAQSRNRDIQWLTYWSEPKTKKGKKKKLKGSTFTIFTMKQGMCINTDKAVTNANHWCTRLCTQCIKGLRQPVKTDHIQDHKEILDNEQPSQRYDEGQPLSAKSTPRLHHPAAGLACKVQQLLPVPFWGHSREWREVLDSLYSCS